MSIGVMDLASRCRSSVSLNGGSLGTFVPANLSASSKDGIKVPRPLSSTPVIEAALSILLSPSNIACILASLNEPSSSIKASTP